MEYLTDQYKKGAWMCLMLCCLAFASGAQTFDEWFRQKKTQKKYLLAQIALLQTYLGYLQKGYEIADRGLTTIHNIKNGDFNLHRDFFGSLKSVNPAIARSVKVADILAFQLYIVQSIRKVNNFCRGNRNFSPEEIRYVARMYRNLIVLTDASASELLTVIQSDQMAMTDDERLQRIDRIYDDMHDKHAFVKSLDEDVRVIGSEREREKRNAEWTRLQYQTM